MRSLQSSTAFWVLWWAFYALYVEGLSQFFHEVAGKRVSWSVWIFCGMPKGLIMMSFFATVAVSVVGLHLTIVNLVKSSCMVNASWLPCTVRGRGPNKVKTDFLKWLSNGTSYDHRNFGVLLTGFAELALFAFVDYISDVFFSYWTIDILLSSTVGASS